MIRRISFRNLCGRRKVLLLILPLLVSFLLLWYTSWWLVNVTSKVLLPPPPPDQNLDHFRRSRSLAHYLDNVQLLIEPTSTSFTTVEEVPVIVLVSSAPGNYESREAIRNTWAKHLPTYFVMGLYGNELNELLVDNYVEAKQYSDIIVFDFHDHYQNLTLKTALMMNWTLIRCPQAQFMFKTDDDVFVNPWALKTVLMENRDAKLLGYRLNDTLLHRDEYTKWYIPRWLWAQDLLPQYLSGTGYLINGDYLRQILKKALNVPMINLEDIYFTYIVANINLGLTLTHDRRLNPHKPYLRMACAYWRLASAHSLSTEEMISVWGKIERIAQSDTDSCKSWNSYLDSDIILY